MNESILNRFKLLMEYDTSKTLSENSLLIEQWVYQKKPEGGGYKLVNGPQQGLKASDIFPKLSPEKYPKEIDDNQVPITNAPIPSFQKKDYDNQFTDPKSDWNKKQAADRWGVDVSRVVWDPNVTKEEQYWDGKGKIHTKKIKVGGWVKMTPETVGKRGVPFGFHPSEYQEYLRRKKALDSVCENRNPICYAKYQQLKDEFYHEEFPYGITRNDFVDWAKSREGLEHQQQKELLAIQGKKLYSNSEYIYSPDLPKSDYFETYYNQLVKSDANKTSANIYGYNELIDILDALYERDPNAIKKLTQTKLEKFWEEWGTVIELIIYVVGPAILTWGASLAVSAAGLAITEGAQLVRIVSVLAEYGIPLAIGTTKYMKQGELTGDSVMDFVFAFLPLIHKAIGIAKQPSAAICTSLASKLARHNTNTVSGMRKFIVSLNEEEKYIFRQVVKNKENLGKHIDDVLKNNIKSANKRAELMVKAIGSKAVGDITPKYGYLLYKGIKYTLVPDITVIEIAKHMAEKYGLTHDKQKKLAKDLEEFRSKHPDWFMPLLAKISDTLDKNKDEDWSKIITNKSYEKLGGDEILKSLNLLNSSWQVDENGNPIEL